MGTFTNFFPYRIFKPCVAILLLSASLSLNSASQRLTNLLIQSSCRRAFLEWEEARESLKSSPSGRSYLQVSPYDRYWFGSLVLSQKDPTKFASAWKESLRLWGELQYLRNQPLAPSPIVQSQPFHEHLNLDYQKASLSLESFALADPEMKVLKREWALDESAPRPQDWKAAMAERGFQQVGETNLFAAGAFMISINNEGSYRVLVEVPQGGSDDFAFKRITGLRVATRTSDESFFSGFQIYAHFQDPGQDFGIHGRTISLDGLRANAYALLPPPVEEPLDLRLQLLRASFIQDFRAGVYLFRRPAFQSWRFKRAELSWGELVIGMNASKENEIGKIFHTLPPDHFGPETLKNELPTYESPNRLRIPQTFGSRVWGYLNDQAGFQPLPEGNFNLDLWAILDEPKKIPASLGLLTDWLPNENFESHLATVAAIQREDLQERGLDIGKVAKAFSLLIRLARSGEFNGKYKFHGEQIEIRADEKRPGVFVVSNPRRQVSFILDETAVSNFGHFGAYSSQNYVTPFPMRNVMNTLFPVMP